MNMLQSVIKEEYNRLEKLVKFYNDKISDFVIGSISWKKRYNKAYAYRVFREGSKVKFIYIGVKNSNRVIELQEQIENRKELELKLKEVKKNLKQAEGYLTTRK